MLNHYYFDGPEQRAAFEEFMKETKNSKTCLFTDPPFACRTEPLSLTLKTIAHNYKKVNSIYHILPIFWVFPYFMENYVQNVMPEMNMVDYMVNYTNHKSYHDGSTGRKDGSPIRIFTNIPLNATTYRLAPYADRCRQLRLQSLEMRRTLADAVLAFDIYNGIIVDDLISPKFVPNVSNFDLRTSTLQLLVEPRVYSAYLSNQPIVRLIKLINKFKTLVSQSSSRTVFKDKILAILDA